MDLWTAADMQPCVNFVGLCGSDVLADENNFQDVMMQHSDVPSVMLPININ